MDCILPTQSSAPIKIDNNQVTSYEVNLTDFLLSKPDESLSGEVEECGKCSPLVCKVAPKDESKWRTESENPQIFVENEIFDENASYDVLMQENVGSDEYQIYVQATKAEELSSSSLSKTPTSTKQMSPYQQPPVDDETFHSPFAADTLQGQFPRPSSLAPENTSAKNQTTTEMMSHASIVNKENMNSSGIKLEAITIALSLRELKKMLKNKLIISDKNNEEEEGRKRPALKMVPENGMVAAEAGALSDM